MKDKFRTISLVVLPAAIITLVTIFLLSTRAAGTDVVVNDCNLVQIIPYLIYPMLLLASSLVFMFLIPEKSKSRSNSNLIGNILEL